MECIFKHALTREVAYNTLLHETRKVIHERTAQAIESARSHELDDHGGNLAHHYTRSGKVEKAIEYSQLAGVQASQRAASTDAVNYFRTALTLLRTLSPSAARDRREFTLLIAMGAQLVNGNGVTNPETGEAFLPARELCEKVRTPVQICAALIGPHVYFTTRGESEKGCVFAQELLQRARAIEKPDLSGYGYVAPSGCNFYCGRIIEARKHAEAGLELYSTERDLHQARFYGYDTRVTGLNCDSLSRWSLGFPEQSSQKVEQSLVYARTLSYPFMHGVALLWAAICHCLRRDYPRCSDGVAMLLPLAQEHAMQEMIAWATILRGWARSQLGERGASAEIA